MKLGAGFTSLPLISKLDANAVTSKGRAFVAHAPILAMDSDFRSKIWELEGPPEAEPTLVDDVAIVCIRGPLSSEPSWYFETYDGILSKVSKAFESAAKTVVIKCCSPGGDVANCFTSARTLREIADGHPDKDFIWYVDGQTCSAALALAMACDRIILPEEARFGSIGVIAELQSFYRQAQAQGVDVALITSGEAKADGHPLAEITEEATARIQESVNYESELFFNWVSHRTSLLVDKVRSLQARIFHGQQALDEGLADEVSSFSGALTMLVEQPPINNRSEVDMPGAINRGSAAEAESDFEAIRRKLAKMAGEDSDEGRKARKLLDQMDDKEPEEKKDDEPKEEPEEEGEAEGEESESSSSRKAEESEDETDDTRKAESEEEEAKACDEDSRKSEDDAESEDTEARKALRAGNSSKASEHLTKAAKLRARAKTLKASAKQHRSMARVFKSNAALAAKLTAVEARVGKKIPTALPTHPAVAAIGATGTRGKGQTGTPTKLHAVPKEFLQAAGLVQGSSAASEHKGGGLYLNTAASPEEAKAQLARLQNELKGEVA